MNFSVLHTFFLYLALASIFAYQKVEYSIEKMYQTNLTEKSIINFHKMVLIRQNRTYQAINGTLEALIDMDNSVELSAEIFIRQGGKYRKTPFRVKPTKFCDFVSKDKYRFEDLFANSDLPSQQDCPAIPKGVYNIRKYMIDPEKLPPTFEGRYHLAVNYHYNNEIVDVHHWFTEIRRYVVVADPYTEQKALEKKITI